MTQALPPRFPITEAQIDLVVAEFYAAIRQHPGLGPIFAAHVTDWTAHEARIAGFWKNAILNHRSYEGSPMRVHAEAGDVRPGMFRPWLALFDAVLALHLPPETASAWSALAHRIGESLMMGLMRWNAGVPVLR